MSEQWTHPVRARLQAGDIAVGMTVTMNSIESAALAATLGFHFLWVEMEHSPLTLETLRAIVLATRGQPAAIFARVPVVELWTAKRVLDQGVSGVIFPFTSTPDLARRAADACRYPPLGRRGSGAGLASLCWPEPGRYHDSADTNVMAVAVVEEASAVECIDEIAATPGIDVIFIGVSDLSFSLGLRGRQDDPSLHRAIARVVTSAREHGKFVGRPAATAEQMLRLRDEGFQFFQAQTDLSLLAAGARQVLAPLGIEAGRKSIY